MKGAVIGTMSEGRFRSITVGSTVSNNDGILGNNENMLDHYRKEEVLPVTLQSHAEVEEGYAAFAKWNIDIVTIENYPDEPRCNNDTNSVLYSSKSRKFFNHV